MTLPYLPVLHNLIVAGNQITTLDVSQCPSLFYLNAGGNPMESVFAKNGSIETFLSVFSIDPTTLKFICVDEDQLASVQQQYYDPEWADLVISSYCTFTPGGTFNTISGQAKIDIDANGCDASDPAMPSLKIKIDDGSQVGYSFVNSEGGFSFYVGEGDHTLTPIFENPTYFNAAPASATVNFPAQDGTVNTQDFCITANGSHQDLEVTFVPIGGARPGFEAFYQVVLRNKGNQSMSGNVAISFEENVLDFVEASETLIQNPGNLTWNFTGLQPFGSQVVGMMFNVNAPTATPPVNINDVLTFTAVAYPLASDEMPQDNTSVLDQVVVGSFDPNDKQCVEGNVVSAQKIGDYLHYVINFENTGTFPAENVVVADLIDTAKFDLSTFQLLSASHPNSTRITGAKVEFIFEGIDLGVNEHGNVVFKIKTKNTLTTGSTVTNKANIFFDYNYPIETNLASTTFQNLQTGDFVQDASVVVSPNPTSGMVRIKADSDIHSVSVYDMQGRIVSAELPSANDFVLDMGRNQSGIYFLKIITAKGISIEKVMKK
ncbi:T9SS type A sorting domain-containing protein [Flavobacterium sp. MAH-1]|uniref:T9SS type A sorting domain-containing protein n=1 Tax=Flavobacterium agri TaxID=2743471 RepID=A0A7Y8Y3Z0_9FLAO|nr:T9SS type A sorting domain-containing protein [Flavobacterium agri]NUY80841.1 T9SS type A sorting domain-containing protein [Flavobacterium agri]NYA70865.1 T9SS type A sorting domain-containing protein [Flavobacterium agri]